MVTWIHPEQLGGRLWFLKQAGSQRFWNVNKHGAFSIPRTALGLRPNDQSCEWDNKWNHQAHYNGNIRLKDQRVLAKELTNVKSAMC